MWKWGRTKIDRQIHLYVLHIFQRTSIHRFGCWCQVLVSQTDRNSFHRRSSFFFVNSGQILTTPSVKDRFWFVVICMYWMIAIVVTPSARNSDILIKCVPRVLWSLFSACLPICNTMISFIHSFISFHSFLHNVYSRYPGLGQTRNKPENALRSKLLDSACDRLTCFRGRGCTFSWWQCFFPPGS
jgi:hypothetical protein